MGTHPIFESDFDCLTEMAETSLTEWAQRWVDGRTGWHKTAPNTTLQKYFPKHIRRVFVPLCGKTVDLIWLVEQGVHVVGAEFSELAVKNFFTENAIDFNVTDFDHYSIYSSKDERLKIYRGDLFAMPESPGLSRFDLVWDRASMVAINPPDRVKYAQKIKSLLNENGQILLQALVREEGRSGPPHTLTKEQISNAYVGLGIGITELQDWVDMSSVERLGKIHVHDYELKVSPH